MAHKFNMGIDFQPPINGEMLLFHYYYVDEFLLGIHKNEMDKEKQRIITVLSLFKLNTS